MLLANAQYMADYDQTIPIVTNAWGTGVDVVADSSCCLKAWSQNKTTTMPLAQPGVVHNGWVHRRLSPYVKNDQLWQCPSMSQKADPANQDQTSYWFGTNIAQRSGGATGGLAIEGFAESALRVAPVDILYIQDAVRWYEPGGAANCIRSTGQAGAYGTSHGLSGDSTMQVGYLDGHAKTLAVMAWFVQVKSNQPWR